MLKFFIIAVIPFAAVVLQAEGAAIVVPGAKSATLQQNQPPKFLCRADGNYRNPYNCSTYYACAGGTTYVMPCPANLVYNAQIDACDWESSTNRCDEIKFDTLIGLAPEK